MRVEFSGVIWLWAIRSQEYAFVTVPEELSAMIKEIPRIPRGFGSVRVQASMGSTVWVTSIFPSSEQNGYILPIKKAVRSAEKVGVDDECSIQLDILDA